LAGIVEVTAVREVPPDEYARRKESGEIKIEQNRDGWTYFSVEVSRHRPFPNGSSAYFFVTERYKTKRGKH